MKIWILAVLAMALPAISRASDGTSDTEYLKTFYCYQLAESPRLAIDLSNDEKDGAENHFVKYLVDRGLNLPTGEVRKDLQLKFSVWVMQRMKADDEKILTWFRENCTQPPTNISVQPSRARSH
jgi:hypothetical protein